MRKCEHEHQPSQKCGKMDTWPLRCCTLHCRVRILCYCSSQWCKDFLHKVHVKNWHLCTLFTLKNRPVVVQVEVINNAETLCCPPCSRHKLVWDDGAPSPWGTDISKEEGRTVCSLSLAGLWGPSIEWMYSFWTVFGHIFQNLGTYIGSEHQELLGSNVGFPVLFCLMFQFCFLLFIPS